MTSDANGVGNPLVDVLRLLPEAGHRPGDTIAGATDADLDDLSSAFGRPLPDDVVAWLRLCNGTLAGEGGIFSVSRIIEELEFWPVHRVRGGLPIAGDGCGNTYVVDSTAGSAVGLFEPIASDEELQCYFSSNLRAFLGRWLRKEIANTRARRARPQHRDYDPWPLEASEAVQLDSELANLSPLPWDAWLRRLRRATRSSSVRLSVGIAEATGIARLSIEYDRVIVLHGRY